MSNSGQSILTSSPGSNFHINLLFDASTASAPAGFQTQIIEAAQYLDAILTDNLTISITVGWGEIGGWNGATGDPLPSGTAEGGPSDYLPYAYSDLSGFLSAHAVSGADYTSVSNLPASDPMGPSYASSGGSWWLTPAQVKLFDPANASDPIDGSIGFSKDWTSDWLGAALHELTHAMGRVSGVGDGYQPTLFDLFRYTSPGALQQSSGPAYFSIDGGSSALAHFGVVSDSSDFRNDSLTPRDTFDEYATTDTWSSLDSTVMDVMGFTLNTSIAPPPTTALPNLLIKSFAFDGHTASWSLQDKGAGVALPTVSGVYLSTDSVVTTSDTLLTSVDAAGLQPGHSEAQSTTLALPGDLAPGTYYLGAIANTVGDVAETSTANNVSNVIAVQVGSSGADTMRATGSVHDLYGFGGDDTLYAGQGSDVLDGGDGNNRAVLSGPFANYHISASGGVYTLNGPYGTDTLYNIQILQFSDRQWAVGASGEALTARTGNDTLIGGTGDDTLIASPGRDVLTGGGGNDHFVFGALQDLKPGAPDTITDFVSGQDHIDISALDALISGGGPFHLGATPGHAGDITVSYDAAHDRTVVDFFTNTDSKADGVLWLTGNHAGLTAGDFVL